ncbi:MAG TPA: NAD(P)-binding oxidoreductase [Polyangiales bacterium]|nr:NAD(P)-binding oxidoreductase [Polyangiales bacterium]
MSVLIIGGSGRTGVHLLRQAAERRHAVRALVRRPETLKAPVGVELLQGTPERLEDLRAAMNGTKAIIVAHNNPRASDNPWAKQINAPTFMTDSARNILAVAAEQHVERVVFLSAIGVGDSWKTAPFWFRAVIKASNIKIGYADHNGVDALVRKSNTDWTLVRAVGLDDEPAGSHGPLHTTEVGGPKPSALTVTRADVATFCLDCVDKNAWIRRSPIIWNDR